jgi:oxaloacetate decarboxylase alpha subunit
MITPLSQFVGSQAAVNVLSAGRRYDTVTDEAIEYALGRWGSAAIDAMDPEVRAKILDRPRAREIEETTTPEPSLHELRARVGNVSDEELILRVYLGDQAAEVFRGDRPAPSSTYADYRAAHDPVLTLLRQFSRMTGVAALEVHNHEMDLVVRRSVTAGQP